MNNTQLFEKKKILKNRTITIKVKSMLITDTSILNRYYSEIDVENACKIGCPNYGHKWSCPPYSKQFTEIQHKFSKAYLLCLSTDMKDYNDIKNKYLAIKAANVTLKTIIEKCARRIEDYAKGYALLSGSCRLCKPCNCKNGIMCKHPDTMRYSMEATSLNVQKLCADLLDHKLLWYDNKKLPLYSSVVSLIMYNQLVDLNGITKVIDDTI